MIVLGGYLIAPGAKRTQFPVMSDPDEEEVLKRFLNFATVRGCWF